VTILSEQGAGDGVHEMATSDDQPDASAHSAALTEFGRAQIKPAQAGAGASRFIPFSADTTQRLHDLADAQGIGVGQLIRQWILDRLEAEEHGRRQDEIAAELERLARRIRASV
jgi:hypothetical protein